MKILTGFLRGRKLPLVPNPALRPTADKVRKAVFDVFQGHVQGKRVLDLYSGTGAMGFEALSQKAAFVRFVERDRSQARHIEATLKRWRLTSSAAVNALDALRMVDRLGLKKEIYDLVFIDPPYGENLGSETLKALSEAGLVGKGGFVVIECGKREILPEKVADLSVVRDKKYGQSRLVIYRNGPGSVV